MPALFALPASHPISRPRRRASVSYLPIPAVDPYAPALDAAQLARDAASEVYRAAPIQAGPARCAPARAVRSLDLKLDQARMMFEMMANSLPPAAAGMVCREVDLARKAFGKALGALTPLRCEATRSAPRGVEVRFLSAQVYRALAHIQATVGGIRRKLGYFANRAAPSPPVP